MSDIGPKTASSALRLLADAIDSGEEIPYAMTYMTQDNKIAASFYAGEYYFMLLGMIDDLKYAVCERDSPRQQR